MMRSGWVAVVVCAGLVTPVHGQDAERQVVLASIDAGAARYGEVALKIWGFAEVGYQEQQSSQLLQEQLRSAGFTVKAGVAEIPTAFTAEWGHGDPVIGIVGEFDALPGLSQAADPERHALVEDGAGHGCGHHLFGTASTAAAIAVKDWLSSSGRSGTLRFFGTPAEEGGAGKVYMLRAGLFADVDAVVTMHPGDRNAASASSSLANVTGKFRFHGISAHASSAPDRGRSALDGVEAMNAMVNLMREHIPSDARVHYVITNGGRAPNVVPDFAEVLLRPSQRRARPRRHLGAHPQCGPRRRPRDGHHHGAGAHGSGVERAPEHLPDRHHAEEPAVRRGLRYTPAERQFAEVLRKSLDGTLPPIDSAASVFTPEPGIGSASTDLGDVSWNVPTVQLTSATWVLHAGTQLAGSGRGRDVDWDQGDDRRGQEHGADGHGPVLRSGSPDQGACRVRSAARSGLHLHDEAGRPEAGARLQEVEKGRRQKAEGRRQKAEFRIQKGEMTSMVPRIDRCVRVVALVCMVVGAPIGAAAQDVRPFDGAESFGVLAGVSVTVSGAPTLAGDVGVDAGGTVTGLTPAMLPAGSTLHAGDAVAAQAHHDAELVHADLASRNCPPANDLTGQDLGGQVLAAGVYCFDGDAPLSSTLTLTGQGPWIFQIGGGLTVGAAATVLAPDVADVCTGTDVFWQIGDADPGTILVPTTIGAGAAFVGNIVALGDVELLGGATVDGRVLSIGRATGASVADGAIALASSTVRACSFGHLLPTATPFKVTGGGSINVPQDPTVTDPDATGTGFANYGFNAQPGAPGAPATGQFNYVNHAIAPHIHANGSVTDVAVVGLDAAGEPQTVRFSGTCTQLLPGCTFSVLVQDNGEPGRNDRFGVTIAANGQVIEARTMRQVRNGNIQFHNSTLTTTVDDDTLVPGQVLRLRAHLRRGREAAPADAYVVLRMPGGQLMSWTGSALVPGLVPLVRNFAPADFDGLILQLQVPAGTPPGVYTWMSALAEPGSLTLLTAIAEQAFTIGAP
ncbi:MAG: amidohydrolase [Vicinamibacterales bacterium]